MPFAEAAGGRARVHWVAEGSGPPLVLIHGTAADGEQWAPARAPLRDACTVVTLDLAGSGRTTDDGGPLTLAALADEVAAVIAAVGLGPAHVAGHSLGAVVASAVAGRHPARVRSVLLHAGWVRSDAHLRALFALHATVLAEAPRRFAELLVATALSPAFLDRLGDEARAELVARLADGLAAGTDRQLALDAVADVGAELTRVRAPVLLIASDQDQLIPRHHHVALQAALPHARVATVTAGHGAPFEALDELVSLIAGFVAELEGVAAPA